MALGSAEVQYLSEVKEKERKEAALPNVVQIISFSLEIGGCSIIRHTLSSDPWHRDTTHTHTHIERGLYTLRIIF